MQLKITTDYAIRIVSYLATLQGTITTVELSRKLCVSESYIPKITRQLKQAGIICASEGVKGGYQLAKDPAEISLYDVVSCIETTMAINRCLEKDGFCSRNSTEYCSVHKALLDVQNTCNNKLKSIKISDLI